MSKPDKRNEILLSNSGEPIGTLIIDGADSVIKLYGKESKEHLITEDGEIYGKLSNGDKISALSCSLTSIKKYGIDIDPQSEITFLPDYIIIGEEFIRANDATIKAISYHFDNIDCIISNHETFKSLWLENDEIYKILENYHRRESDLCEKQGWPIKPFKPNIGEYAQLLYYNGAIEIAGVNTDIGRISITNRTSHSSGGATGIGIKNKITASIIFTEPKTLQEATYKLAYLHGLFELSIGYRQRFAWIELELTRRSNKTQHDLPQRAELHWSLCNERVKRKSRGSLHDALFSPDLNPEEFISIAAGWMNTASEMTGPRTRFATAFFDDFSINRIVGAANMFDLLPNAYIPIEKHVNEELNQAIISCKEILKKYNEPSDSFAKQSILHAFSRIGKPSLRDKIYGRAGKITAVAHDRFPDINIACHQAVICRNHYVHGSYASFSYDENFNEFAFIVETLEFVFAASDLIELGWDLNRWINQGTSFIHPFGEYVYNYAQNIKSLKTLIGKK